MRTTRLVACTVTTGLAWLTTLAIAAPSHAADTYDTSVVASPSATQVHPRWDAEAGTFVDDAIDVDLDIDSDAGGAPAGGTTTLLAQRAGSSEWVPVAQSTSTTTATTAFTGLRPTVRTTYKAVYGGWTAPDGDVYGRAASAAFTVSVARRITYPVAGFVVRGRVTPRYGNQKIKVKVSKQRDAGFTSFTTIRTGSTGTYRIRLPRRGGEWYWRFAVKGNAKYLASGFVWRTFIG